MTSHRTLWKISPYDRMSNQDYITAEETPIYDALAAMLAEENSKALAWRDIVDNVWDI